MGTGTEIHTFRHSNPVRVVSLSNSAAFAFSAAQGREVVLWDATTGEALIHLHEKNPGVTSALFAADDNQLLVGYVNRTIELWDTRNIKLLRRWRMKSRNTWHPKGSAILGLSFGNQNNRFFVLTGAGRMYQIQGI